MPQPAAPAYYRVPQFPTRAGPARMAVRRRRLFPRWALIGIFLILLAGFVIQARSFLMPVTLALLLFFVFVPFRRALGRIGIGPGVSAAIITLGMIAAVGGLGLLSWGPVSELMDNAPQITRRLETRFNEIRASIRPLEEAAAKIQEVTGGGSASTTVEPPAPTPAPGTAQVTATATARPGAPGVPERISVEVNAAAANGPTMLERLAGLGPAVGGQVMFTLVLLFFMLSSGDLLYLRIVQSFESVEDKRAAYTALRNIEDSLGTYLGTITLINVGVGVAIGLAMWAWGMPAPLLWGVGAFVLNYIPYLGAAAGALTGALVGLFVFDDLLTPLLVGGTFVAVNTVEGQFLTPYFVSRKLEMNEIVVFIAVALWAWFWSVLGMIVAVPLLVVFRVLAAHVPGLERFGDFLAGEPPPAFDDAEGEAPAAETAAPKVHVEEARAIIEAGDEAHSAEEVEEVLDNAAAGETGTGPVPPPTPTPAAAPAGTGANPPPPSATVVAPGGRAGAG